MHSSEQASDQYEINDTRTTLTIQYLFWQQLTCFFVFNQKSERLLVQYNLYFLFYIRFPTVSHKQSVITDLLRVNMLMHTLP